MDLELTGKTALVTGSSKGIGKSIAEILSVEGCNIMLNSRHLLSSKTGFFLSPLYSISYLNFLP